MTKLARQKMAAEHCGDMYVLLRREVAGCVEIAAIPRRCKSWACPRCAAHRARKLAERTLAWARGKNLTLFTVTFASGLGFEGTWADAAACWNRFRTAFVKKFGSLRFVRVLEVQPGRLYPHYHILLDRYIPHAWCEEELRSAGFGPVKKFDHLDGAAAYFYILKYLRKPWPDGAGTEMATELGLRRFSSSRDCLPATEKPSGWRRYQESLTKGDVELMLRMVTESGGETADDFRGVESSYSMRYPVADEALRGTCHNHWYKGGFYRASLALLWTWQTGPGGLRSLPPPPSVAAPASGACLKLGGLWDSARRLTSGREKQRVV